MQFTILGSGSGGNATLIESATTQILIDAGLSARQIAQRLEAIGQNIGRIRAVILSHEHSDHTRALGALGKNRPLAVYANRLTAEAVSEGLQENGAPRMAWHLFSTGQAFSIGDIEVETFSVPHDAYDPVGFVVRHGSQAVGMLTDLGHVTKLVLERVRNTDALVLEANHDMKLLQEDHRRPWATKQRIMSRHGHLNNEAAASLAEAVAGERLRHVCLAHLSRDCNRPALAQRVVADSLQRVGASHIQLSVASQHEPAATINL